MILYFEKEGARRNRDWLLRLAQAVSPSAVVFREQAERLTREIDECEERNKNND